MSLEANEAPPQYSLPAHTEDLFVPACSKHLEGRGLLLKQVVDEYEEGYQQVDEPILCMAVIHFHHKRGTEIEYRYPASKAVEEI